MDYLRLFSTENEYDLTVEDFEYPTVSYVTDTDTVHYMEKPPHDYSKDYLTFEALEDGTFTLTIPSSVNTSYMTSVSYSIDGGETWTTTNVDSTAQTITTPTVNAGDVVLWKGVGNALTGSGFSSTGNFNASGNIMSLVYGDNFVGQTIVAGAAFYRLFMNNAKIVSAENMVLPATTLAKACYRQMFIGCTSLTTAPSILPATTLAGNCYQYMFSNCTSLITAPELPATTLESECYSSMFNGCTNLNNIKMLATSISATNCLQNWVQGVAATGTFVKNSAATWTTTGVNGVPTGWTVETASA